MASLTLTAATTVAAFKSEFNAAFGATLRVYNGGKVADDSVTLGELGLSADGPFECRSSLTVDSFIERMKSEHNLKVKVYTCDGWVAVLGGLTLESAGKVKKNAVKADMESMIAYQRTGESPSDEYSVIKNEDGSYTVSINGVVQDNAKAAMRQIAEAIGFDYDPDWTTRQFGSKLAAALGCDDLSAPVSSTETAPSPANDTSAEIEAARMAAEKAKAQAEAEAKAAKEEFARIQAEAEKAKKDAEAAKAALEKTKKETDAVKATSSKAKSSRQSSVEDPFEALMVKVCAGLFKQKVYYPVITHHHTDAYDDYPDGDRRRKPIHKPAQDWDETKFKCIERRVTISKPFFICKVPVTQGLYKTIMGAGFNPSHFRGNDNLPVESVTWDDIQQFLFKLNTMTGKKYRLPTESEWEWAAMGAEQDNDQGSWSGFSNEDDADSCAWWNNNSGLKTHPVGEKRPNELGLYDMTGNVWEVCKDTIDPSNGKNVEEWTKNSHIQ